MASATPTFNSDNRVGAESWATKVKDTFTKYSSAEYGIELSETDTQEIEMVDVYNRFVKTLRPKLESGKNGLVVTGLDKLFIAHGEDPIKPEPDIEPVRKYSSHFKNKK